MRLAIFLLASCLAAMPIYGGEVAAGVNFDGYEDSDDFVETLVSLEIKPWVARVSRAERFDLDDVQAEIEFYPRISTKSYLYLNASVAEEGALYPDWRVGAEIYRTLPRAFEISAGVRHFEFDESVDLFTASVAKYAGNWYVAGRGYFTDENTNGQLIVRRYLSDSGDYVGLRAGVGRDEIRSQADVEVLDRTEVAAEAFLFLSKTWTTRLRAGVADDRNSLSVALGYRF